VLCTYEEVILDTKKDKMSELFSVGFAISHESFDKYIEKERELEHTKEEVVFLKHLVKYYE
jgi:hypothetical protein